MKGLQFGLGLLTRLQASLICFSAIGLLLTQNPMLNINPNTYISSNSSCTVMGGIPNLQLKQIKLKSLPYQIKKMNITLHPCVIPN